MHQQAKSIVQILDYEPRRDLEFETELMRYPWLLEYGFDRKGGLDVERFQEMLRAWLRQALQAMEPEDLKTRLLKSLKEGHRDSPNGPLGFENLATSLQPLMANDQRSEEGVGSVNIGFNRVEVGVKRYGRSLAVSFVGSGGDQHEWATRVTEEFSQPGVDGYRWLLPFVKSYTIRDCGYCRNNAVNVRSVLEAVTGRMLLEAPDLTEVIETLLQKVTENTHPSALWVPAFVILGKQVFARIVVRNRREDEIVRDLRDVAGYLERKDGTLCLNDRSFMSLVFEFQVRTLAEDDYCEKVNHKGIDYIIEQDVMRNVARKLTRALDDYARDRVFGCNPSHISFLTQET